MRAAMGTFVGGFLAASVLGASPVTAQEMIDATQPERIAELLKGFGIARLGTHSDGEPLISGRINGKTYEVFFFDCNDGKECRNIQFWAYWDEPAQLDAINAWNRQTWFGRTYLDEEDDLVLEYAVNLSHGVAEQTLEDSADIWMRMLKGVEEDILGK
jgi:hypothetical protein